MKKWVVGIIVLFLFALKANGQTYTQTFIDKCTGEVKLATTTYVNGRAFVSFYDQMKVFTPEEVQSGAMQIWLQIVYTAYSSKGWRNRNVPCPNSCAIVCITLLSVFKKSTKT